MVREKKICVTGGRGGGRRGENLIERPFFESLTGTLLAEKTEIYKGVLEERNPSTKKDNRKKKFKKTTGALLDGDNYKEREKGKDHLSHL